MRFGFVWILVVSMVATCVPEVDIEGAPCECPDGYTCCPTSKSCIREGNPCPRHYPPSSGQACERNDDCPANESCRSWRVDGSLHGTKLCRRECPEEFPCDAGETCELSPHDGHELVSLNVTRLCVPEAPPEGCEGIGCRTCTRDQLGLTFCETDNVHACMIALHATCGLSCSLVEVQDCNLAGCTEIEGGAKCEDYGFGAWCLDYPCAACGNEKEGGFFCDGQDVVACNSIPLVDGHCPDAPCGCDTICIPEVIESCAGGCVEDDGAHCIP